MKKVLSVVLALALILALAVPAFASTPEGSNKLEQSTKYTAETKVATIAIVVPTSGAFVVNPYKMTIAKIGEADVVAADQKKQIISAPVEIINNSTLAVSVKGTVTGTIAGNAKFAVGESGSLTETEQAANSVLLNFKYGAPAVPTASGSTVAMPSTGTTTVPVSAKATAFGGDNDSGVPTIKLEAGYDADGNAIASAKSAMVVGFDGVASDKPKTPWTSADKVTATVAYTFTPLANTTT